MLYVPRTEGSYIFSVMGMKIYFLCYRELMEHGGTNVRQPQNLLKNTQIYLLLVRIL
jgi:hypothetical protein